MLWCVRTGPCDLPLGPPLPLSFNLPVVTTLFLFCYVAQARIINYHRSVYIVMSIIYCLRIVTLGVVFHIQSIDGAMSTPF